MFKPKSFSNFTTVYNNIVMDSIRYNERDVVYLNSDPTIKFTVHSIINFRGETQIELVYFSKQNNRFEYPKFAPELLDSIRVAVFNSSFGN